MPQYINHLHVSPIFGVKQPNKIRPIHHLSFPKNSKNKFDASVNDILLEKLKTAQYTTFQDVVKMVLTAGKNSYLFIVDAQDAYYRVPIHEQDHHLLGIKWAKHFWFFTCLQMGLSSSCNIYTQFADAIEYIIIKNNKNTTFSQQVQLLRHYLDDFFGVHADYSIALHNFYQLLYWFRRLGVPTKASKCLLVK